MMSFPKILTVKEMPDYVNTFLEENRDKTLFAIDYRDNGVFLGICRAKSLEFYDGSRLNPDLTAELRIFNSQKELYLLKTGRDEYIARPIEDEDDKELFHLDGCEEIGNLPHNLVFDELHELWGKPQAEDINSGWFKYTEDRGTVLMLPREFNRDGKLPSSIYVRVRNYLDARDGNVIVKDARLCGFYYRENGKFKEVLENV